MRLPLFFFLSFIISVQAAKIIDFFLIINQYSGLGKYSNKAKQCPVHPFIKKKKKKDKQGLQACLSSVCDYNFLSCHSERPQVGHLADQASCDCV